jgi:hypothetical protein
LFQRSNLLGLKGKKGMIALEASNSLPSAVFRSSPFYPMPKELVSGNKISCSYHQHPCKQDDWMNIVRCAEGRNITA